MRFDRDTIVSSVTLPRGYAGFSEPRLVLNPRRGGDVIAGYEEDPRRLPWIIRQLDERVPLARRLRELTRKIT
jgi:hypothetical protein